MKPPQEHAGTDDEALKTRVRAYWDAHVDDWKIATHPSGSPEFFREIEEYRFDKLEYLARRVNFAGYPGRSVLDVGCGLGNDVARFATGGSEVTGIDISPRAVELARANFSQRGLAGRFEVMDGEAMSFPDAAFDVVYCHTVLHFTPDPARMVREIRRVTKPDGVAILMTVNRKSWMNWLRHVMKVDIDHLDSPVFRHMTMDEFRSILAPFPMIDLRSERFPVPTKVHKGLKALVYNGVFVGGFNSLPASWTNRTGHHLLAFCRQC
ncbi:class I SAM-dependent methyltransferase [Wenzhouxiangella sp. XN24]|uniref:class I SAM-dependent methyltransferase n=1 Tax=Wenzhouxiangella sp. XN24 TaxID=2713569 RepID=UPI0013EC1E7B|nr:class I SAM-dependent methyltransferase [Wenzhouxiangella sp. XN24]NGX16863.1 methyltransferase domain-containing protein [Wenzhouxiangella sp. XN24]